MQLCPMLRIFCDRVVVEELLISKEELCSMGLDI